MSSFTLSSSRQQRIAAAFAVAAMAVSSVAQVNASGVVPSLTLDTFAQETAGKVVFIKFFAPWCGHCKSMAADWEQLATDFADNTDSIMIAEVDCTGKDGGEQLCDKSEVNGFPTLKFGDPSAMEEYEGSRDYESLVDFVKQLKPTCGVDNLELCDDAKKEAILKFQQMSVEELEKSVAENDKEMDSLNEWFTQEEDRLQDLYETLHDDHMQKRNDLKETKMAGLIKSVLISKQLEQQSSSASSTEL
jgi:protein disulfide-isomerase-like protein